jgi:hypothetical protein
LQRISALPRDVADVRFEVLTALATRTAVFWYEALCSPVEVHKNFGRINLPPSSGSESKPLK